MIEAYSIYNIGVFVVIVIAVVAMAIGLLAGFISKLGGG